MLRSLTLTIFVFVPRLSPTFDHFSILHTDNVYIHISFFLKMLISQRFWFRYNTEES